MNKNLKIVLLTGTAAVCAVGAFFLHRSDERAGTVNSVQKVETAIADKTFRTKSEAYEAFANEKERFYNRSAGASGEQTMFRAVIHGTRLLKAGQTALLRTKEPIRYGSLVVPANTLLSGIALIAENRLTIKITSVRLGRQVFALPLEVYGSDGMAGLPLDGDIVNKVAGEQTSSAAIQETGAAASRYGGTVGRVAGALISGVGNRVRSAKNGEIKLIDNQIVILKISER